MINLSKSAGFNLGRRHRSETRFQWAGRFAIFVSLAFLVIMLATIFRDGRGVLFQTQVALNVDLGPDAVDPADPGDASYGKIVKSALKDQFPDVKKRKELKKLYNLVSSEASFEIERLVEDDLSLLGGVQTIWVTASDDLDLLMRGRVDTTLPEKQRRI